MPDFPSDATPNDASPPLTLSYASAAIDPTAGELVTIGKFANVHEATMRVGALAAAGIPAVTSNDNTAATLGALYGSIISVEVRVRKDDEARARELLRLSTSDEVEPADEQITALPPTEEGGDSIPLAVVGRYPTIRALREAAILLESSRIQAVIPNLVARGDKPAGEGNRFHLRVPEADADRAEEILESEADEVDEDELRCPKCNSWNTHPVGTFVKSILSSFGLAEKPTAQIECLACKYRGAPAEFARK